MLKNIVTKILEKTLINYIIKKAKKKKIFS